MDDIIITGNKSSFVTSIIKLLGVDFDLKDLGLLHYFLGLQIDYTSSGLFVHQTKYASDLNKKFGMIDCKPCKTPSSPNSHLLPNDSPLFLILLPIGAWLVPYNILHLQDLISLWLSNKLVNI